jgi:hypothetical protein
VRETRGLLTSEPKHLNFATSVDKSLKT